MNIYDTKLARCTICGKCIGEINFEATIKFAKCGQCNQADTDTKPNKKTPPIASHSFTAISC